MRFSSNELDGCDFATEEDFDNPAKKGGYDEATRVVNNIQVDSNYIFSNFNLQSNPSTSSSTAGRRDVAERRDTAGRRHGLHF